MKCSRCGKPFYECKAMRPIDPPGTKDRRWVCLDCETVAENAKVDPGTKEFERIFWRTTMSEWISVKDRLPEDFKKVIVYLHFPSGGDIVDMAYFMGGEGWCYTSWEDQYHDCVTHWMPLPEPPKEV